jgi:hypothetical protein
VPTAIAAAEDDANTAVSAHEESEKPDKGETMIHWMRIRPTLEVSVNLSNAEGRNVTYCSSVLATALLTTEAREGLISFLKVFLILFIVSLLVS